tara:strand:+ start:46 stop:630 length:585 start_codon:yes stop_codon:yes gene_type:complete
MENQLKHNIVFTIKSLLIIAILLFKYNAVKFINLEESSNLETSLRSTIKSFTEIIIAIIIILFVIINLNIGLDFNSEVSTYINIFYIFIILTLGIILNNLDYINDYKTIALTIFITLCLAVVCIIDYTQKNGKISKWLLNYLLNSNNDENYEEKSILLLDNGLNYILFFIFLYIFLQIMTRFINKINKTFLKIM